MPCRTRTRRKARKGQVGQAGLAPPDAKEGSSSMKLANSVEFQTRGRSNPKTVRRDPPRRINTHDARVDPNTERAPPRLDGDHRTTAMTITTRRARQPGDHRKTTLRPSGHSPSAVPQIHMHGRKATPKVPSGFGSTAKFRRIPGLQPKCFKASSRNIPTVVPRLKRRPRGRLPNTLTKTSLLLA